MNKRNIMKNIITLTEINTFPIQIINPPKYLNYQQNTVNVSVNNEIITSVRYISNEMKLNSDKTYNELINYLKIIGYNINEDIIINTTYLQPIKIVNTKAIGKYDSYIIIWWHTYNTSILYLIERYYNP
jgi:hypothetical protein